MASSAPPLDCFAPGPQPEKESLRLTEQDEAQPVSHTSRAARVGLAVLGGLMVGALPMPALASEINDLAPSVTIAVENQQEREARTRHPYAAAVKNPTVKVDSLPRNPNRYQVDRAIDQVSARYGVPPEIIKSIAWQESSWTQMRDGRVVINVNKDKRTGAVRSTDWGLLQINDRAHPKAFPRARTDVRYNLEFAANLLSSLYQENGQDWDRAVSRYNGVDNPQYLQNIHRIETERPWTYGVAHDELGMRQDQRRGVERKRAAAAREVAWRDQLVKNEEKRVAAFGDGIHPASQRHAHDAAEKELAARQQHAQAAHAKLDALTAQETDLDGQIATLTQTEHAEAQRIHQIEHPRR